MSALVARCTECGFENPRTWTACARCGHLLGPRTPSSAGGLFSPETSPSDTLPTAQMELNAHGEPRGQLKRRGKRQTDLHDGGGDAQSASPFVDRPQATGPIWQGLEAAFSGKRATLVALQGGPGSGKTRLLIRASELAARKYNRVRVLYGLCRTPDDGPYAPFSRLFLERFGITPSSSPRGVRIRMANIITEALAKAQGKPDAASVLEATHLLGHMAGVPFPDSTILRPLAAKPDELHRRTCLAARRFMEGEAHGRPLLILLDDMGRAEKEAWDLLDSVLDVPRAIAVVAAGRDPVAQQAAKLAAQRHVVSADIPPLSQSDVLEMVKLLVPELRTVPESVLAALSRHSKGNPSALRELLYGLMQEGLFANSDAGLVVDFDKIEQGALSLTMEDLIRARRDGLDTFERAVVERAAVVGEIFWEGVLLALQRAESRGPGEGDDALDIWADRQDETALGHALSLLEDKGFVIRIERSNVAGLSEYTFHDTGTRRVIYNDLPDDVRVRRHAVIARWLSTVPRLRPEGVAALIAPHLEHAGLSSRAGRAYLESAMEEHRRMRTTMALRCVEKALPLIDPEDILHRFNALHEHGSLLTVVGRYEDAEMAFLEMLRLAWSLGARGKAGAALNRIARIHRERGSREVALDHLQKALLLFKEANDQRGVASTFDDLAQVHRSQGNLDEALAAAKGALEIRIREKDRRGQALSLNTMGCTMLDLGDFSAAEANLHSALELRKAIGDHQGAVQTRLALGRLAYYRRRFDDAIGNYETALESAREQANRSQQTALLNHLGQALLEKGELDTAQAAFEEAKALAQQISDLGALAEVQCNLGLVSLRQGRADANQALDEAMALARAHGTLETLALAHRAMGRLRAKTLFSDGSQTDGAAEQSYRECIRIFGEYGNRHEKARSLAELGLHLIERGDTKAGREVLREAHNAMQELGLPEVVRVQDTLAQL